MLNYIWAGLIIFSLVFALASDVADITQDTYRNGELLPVTLAFPDGPRPDARRQSANVHISQQEYQAFYGTDNSPDSIYSATLIKTAEGTQLRFEEDANLPEPLATIRDVTNPRDAQLQGQVVGFSASQGGATALRFEPVRFVKMNAISGAALDFAETAAEIALGLIGVLALFLGLLKIAEEAGVIYAIVKLVRPILRPLFPEIPEDHPALGMIALNLAANIFGLGNAATPFGIKAMEELQTLNSTEDTATNSMVMLLAVNTASVQLVPPVLLLALMGLQINQLIFAIIITTFLSLVIAITAAKLLGKLKAFKQTDPALVSTSTPSTEEG
ncbi:MAG: nucleoside recognition domain-containing protein [Rubricoccaceae bacterium]|nr:nucleoside recognition domain-containing protein [Rubricoccaceae bacterium]